MIMRPITLLSATVTAAYVVCAPVWAQEDKPEDIYAKILPSTMTLAVETREGKKGVGTGFMCVKEGMAITAWHVVRDAKRVVARFSTGEEFEVSGLVDKDEVRDIALIRVKVFGRPILPTLPTDPAVGSKAFVIGSPKGLEFSFSDGMVSQIQMLEGIKQYQFTCASSPGNSGGPLINTRGEVIGVVAWQVKESQNLNFAVPITYALGLDTTLPTQPWETVKASPSTKTETETAAPVAITAAEFDKLIADSLVMWFDVSITNDWVTKNVLYAPDGYLDGMPALSYALKADATARIDRLNALRAPDKERERWLAFTRDYLSRATKRLDYIEKAVRRALANEGFDSDASELVKQGDAVLLVTPAVRLGPDDLTVLKGSQEFMEAFPVDLKYMMGFEKNDSVPIGISIYPRHPLILVLITKDSVADKMGLKEGDTILSSGGTTFESMRDFNLFVQNNLGKKVKLSINRDHKLKEIDLKIPASLTKK